MHARELVGKKKDTFHFGWGADQQQSTQTKALHPNKPRDNFTIGWGATHQTEEPRNRFNPHLHQAPVKQPANHYAQQDNQASNQRLINKQRNQVGNNIFHREEPQLQGSFGCTPHI